MTWARILAQIGLAGLSIWISILNSRLRRQLRRVTAERDAWRADHDALLRGVQDMSAWDRAHARPPLQ